MQGKTEKKQQKCKRQPGGGFHGCLSVAPGWVKTGMIDKPIEEIGSRLHMKGRIILLEEIANAIWLMSLPVPLRSGGSAVHENTFRLIRLFLCFQCFFQFFLHFSLFYDQCIYILKACNNMVCVFHSHVFELIIR